MAGRSSICQSIDTHDAVSGSFGPTDQRSSILACTVRLRWVVNGLQDVGVVNVHIHRVTAKRGENSSGWQAMLAAIEAAMTACDCRVLAGDANMALFLVAAGLRARGWEIRLAANHREVAVTKPVDLLTEQGRRSSLLYDSLGAQGRSKRPTLCASPRFGQGHADLERARASPPTNVRRA